jgi:DNA-binding SARP family transcriptional activator/Tfp pilus assembly protein PilF
MLSLALLGPGELALDGRGLKPRSTKTLALLAYLALEHERPHARSRLAELLWGGFGDAAARQSLRQALHALRALGNGRLADHVAVDGEQVRFVPGPAAIVDVHRFLHAAAATDASGWREAAAEYRAPLLDGLSLDDSPGFDDWLSSARDRLHSIAVHNLDRLAADGIAHGDWDGAYAHAQALRTLDPAGEVAARHLMRVLAARHDAAGLAAEWARLRDTLRREYGIEPTAATARLHDALRRSIAGTDAPADPDRAPRRAAGGSTAAGAAPPILATDALVRAAQAAERVYAFGPALDLYERALATVRDGDPRSREQRCDLLLRKEAALDRLGRRAAQVATIDELLELSRDDPIRHANALLRRANICAYLGDHHDAAAAATRALQIYRTAADRPGEAEAIRELGFAAWYAGRYPEALDHAREALALHRTLGDVAGEASALHNLAELHCELGSPRQALAWFEQALAIHWAAGSREGEILTRFGMGHARLRLDDEAGATREYEAALALSERYGERTMQSRALQALAARSLARGDHDAALRSMRRALDVDRSINYAHALGHDLVQLSAIHLHRGERSESRAALAEALVWFDLTEDRDSALAVQAYARELDRGGSPPMPVGDRVRSHLPLSEGKVYCAFESPLAHASPRRAAPSLQAANPLASSDGP